MTCGCTLAVPVPLTPRTALCVALADVAVPAANDPLPMLVIGAAPGEPFGAVNARVSALVHTPAALTCTLALM